MKINYADTGDLIGGFSIQAENDSDCAILSIFVRATERGAQMAILSSTFQDGETKAFLLGRRYPTEEQSK